MKNLLYRLYKVLTRREKILAGVVVMLFAITSLLEVAGLGLIFVYVKLIMDPGEIAKIPYITDMRNFLHLYTDKRLLTFLGIIMLMVMLAKSVGGIFSLWASTRFSAGRMAAFSRDLYNIFLARDFRFFLSRNSATLKQQITDETYSTVFNVMIPIFSLISELLTLAVIVGFLLVLQPYQTLAMFLVVAILFSSFILSTRRFLDSMSDLRSKSNAQRHKLIGDTFSSVKEMIIWNAQSVFSKRFGETMHNYAVSNTWNIVLSQMPRMLVEMAGFIIIVGLMIYYLQISENPAEVVSIIALYGAAGMRMMPSFSRIAQNVTSIRFSKRAFYSIVNDLQHRRSMQKVQFKRLDHLNPLPFEKKIEIDNIIFSYTEDGAKILDEVSMVIHKHSSVAFVGPSGAGKSTLMDILLGVFLPDKGQVRIDGEVLDTNNLGEWRANIGYVPQKITLLDDTVAANIAFGAPEEEIDMEQVRWACKVAQIDKFIEEDLSHGYETHVGDRGVRLSGGQAQRIAIARALYRKPSVLVMDEATSALDNITEREITDTLVELAGKTTMIMIAHRLSTVKHCDMIYLFEKGKISDWGTYNALLERNPLFRKMAGE